MVGWLARTYLRLALQAASAASGYGFGVLVGLTPVSTVLLLADVARRYLDVALGAAGMSLLLLLAALTVSVRHPRQRISVRRRLVRETLAVFRAVSGSTLACIAMRLLSGSAILPDASPLIQVTGAFSACLALNGLSTLLALVYRT